MKHALFIPICLLQAFYLQLAAQPSRDWDKTYGSFGWEELHLAIKTTSGTLVGGNLTASGGDVTQPVFGGNDIWIIMLDQSGNKVWEKVYGGSKEDKLWAMMPLPEGGYLLGGTSSSDSSGNKLTHNYGEEDYWLIKINAQGEKLWEKTIGGSGEDQLFALKAFPDSTWLLAGWSNSPADGLKTRDSLGVYDMWVMRVDPQGEIIWQEVYGGDQFDNVYDVVATSDGGFLLGGASASGISATKTTIPVGRADYWVIKIDEDGFHEWDVSFGGSEVDQLHKILPLKDGNYMLLGGSDSPSSGNHNAPNRGNYDFWALKMDATGKKIWDKTYGGSNFDEIFDGLETVSGNIVLAGTSNSTKSGTKSSDNIGGYDYWLVYIDKDGNQIWDKSYGGTKSDAMTVVLQTENAGLLLLGHSESNKGGFKAQDSRGHNDFWMMKTYCNVQGELPADTIFCQNDLIPLSIDPINCANGGCIVQWSNGLETNNIELVPNTDSFIAFWAEDRNACFVSDTLKYTVLPAPSVNLGKDTSIFEEGATVFINAFENGATFEWSTGDTNPFITVSETGTYAVTLTADNGCQTSDEIKVCACDKRLLYIPNVFQPDVDIYNDTWYIQSKSGAIETLELIEVYDRWGHRMFRAENAQPNLKAFGWDGTNEGKRCLPNVYTYMVRARYSNEITENIYGTVTLIR